MTDPVPVKYAAISGEPFLFHPFDLGTLFEVIEEDGSTRAVLIPGTFIQGLWWKGSPVLDPDRTIEPVRKPGFYREHGCNPPVELRETPFFEDYAND